MEFKEAIAKRRAIRKYKGDPIPEEKLKRLYEALRLAPTGNNRQPFKFIFVKDQETRKQIVKKACHQEFLLEAPILMVACCERGHEFDVAIAVDHMVLTATDEGLGTCWVGWFEGDAVKKLLNIPAHLEVPIIIPIGYADEKPAPRSRKQIGELVCEDRYR